MRRFVLVLAAVAAAVVVATAGAVPPGPPPKVSGAKAAPPPAWVDTGRVQRWLAYSSYCWRTQCVDMILPAGRPDLPIVRVRVGQRLVIHLGFAPRSVIVREVTQAGTGRSWPLAASRTTSWRVRKAAIVLVEAKGAPGSAGYLARLRF